MAEERKKNLIEKAKALMSDEELTEALAKQVVKNYGDL